MHAKEVEPGRLGSIIGASDEKGVGETLLKGGAEKEPKATRSSLGNCLWLA